ncbi:hypothetical protein [Variovorax sp. Sphag1AA]|uniref:hypothetical protein n=1 Tax=Variovorax sp. Sphag1AA TaxID=2587027 RepID=UPI00162038DC|nr:hypothetical protein [Variovorax sp. Sphag1AA]MBB3175994.1 SOS-response transcriptional repressor LexA [Variovorax sp. Sphag1AA]
MTLWQLTASNTHLYPGARLRATDTSMRERIRSGDRIAVEFADQMVANGDVIAALPHGGWTLRLEAHTTAKRTAIEEKRWDIQWMPRGDSPGTMKVKARAA